MRDILEKNTPLMVLFVRDPSNQRSTATDLEANYYYYCEAMCPSTT